MKKTSQASRHLIAILVVALALAFVCHIARSFERPCPALIRHDVSWKAFCQSTGRQLADTSENARNEYLDTWCGSALEEEALISNNIEP